MNRSSRPAALAEGSPTTQDEISLVGITRSSELEPAPPCAIDGYLITPPVQEAPDTTIVWFQIPGDILPPKGAVGTAIQIEFETHHGRTPLEWHFSDADREVAFALIFPTYPGDVGGGTIHLNVEGQATRKWSITGLPPSKEWSRGNKSPACSVGNATLRGSAKALNSGSNEVAISVFAQRKLPMKAESTVSIDAIGHQWAPNKSNASLRLGIEKVLPRAAPATLQIRDQFAFGSQAEWVKVQGRVTDWAESITTVSSPQLQIWAEGHGPTSTVRVDPPGLQLPTGESVNWGVSVPRPIRGARPSLPFLVLSTGKMVGNSNVAPGVPSNGAASSVLPVFEIRTLTSPQLSRRVADELARLKEQGSSKRLTLPPVRFQVIRRRPVSVRSYKLELPIEKR